ncbi:MAG TPA: SAM-dependent chlorinase/fluorinase, partial [Rhizomicrobium sp.]|nr:SAM-dependent chlorinase/fluorinase [Rhizomicrobium sp.]
TDFGLEDHYVGAMKGAILNRCPQAHVVDISHGIPPFSVLSGAYALSQAAPYFPRGTVHVVVVDPGVGTTRRAILVSAGGHTFIAPDNGVLTLALEHLRPSVVRQIANAELFRHPVSATFHGRDIFGPVGAAIAAGVDAQIVGPEIVDYVTLSDTEPQQTGTASWRGIALSVDRFGNIITNFPASEFARPGLVLSVAGSQIREIYPTFGAAPEGAIFLYTGSSGFLEIAANRASAAQTLRVQAGAPLELSLDR